MNRRKAYIDDLAARKPSNLCPCCGGLLPSADLTADLRTNCLIAGGLALKATPRAVELVSFLVDRYPRWTPFDDLFSGVLGEQATSRNQIQHALKTSRLSLGKLGWAIENEPSRGYRIKRAELSAPPLSPSISAQYSEGSMMTVDPAGPPSAT